LSAQRHIRRGGPVPLHHQVYLDLRAALDDGTFAPGDRLPPERSLAEQYGCSLITVRRALDELAREQRIDRVPGRGTHVLRPRIDRDLGDTNSFSQEMARFGLVADTRVIATRAEAAGPAVAAVLDLPAGAPTLYVERLRLASSEPLLLEMVHLPAERFPGLLASDLEHGSLYDLLTERYDTHIATARETLEPVLLKAREARLLGQKPGMPALLVDGIAFTAGGVPVEYSRTYVRGDRTRYYVERVVVREGARAADRQANPVGSRPESFVAAT
jgi:GntR family transcriptional regulator